MLYTQALAYSALRIFWWGKRGRRKEMNSQPDTFFLVFELHFHSRVPSLQEVRPHSLVRSWDSWRWGCSGTALVQPHFTEREIKTPRAQALCLRGSSGPRPAREHNMGFLVSSQFSSRRQGGTSLNRIFQRQIDCRAAKKGCCLGVSGGDA